MRASRWAWVWALITIACAHPSPPRAAIFDAARSGSLAARAAEELGCARPTLSELAPRHVVASGCERQREYREVCGAGGCTWVALDDLTLRASFDLDCPGSRLHVRTLGDSTRGVVGCGYRATYVLVCTDAICHWLPSTRDRSSHEAADRRRAGW